MYMWWYVWTLLLITVFDYNVWHNHAEVWSKSRPDFDTPVPKSGRSSDQTSTLGGRSLVEIPTKLRPPPVSKFGRSLVEVLCRSLVDILMLLCISFIYRATFDQTSSLGVSKFGRSLAEVWSKLGRSLVEAPTELRPPQCRSLVEIAAKLRHPSVEYMHI